MIGARLGSYQIVQALGEGGMGAVYVGEHTVLGRKAAIKVLHPDLARQPETVKRFLQEARSATRVKHSGLVDVIDFGTDEWGNAFLVMELLDGESLGSRSVRDLIAMGAAPRRAEHVQHEPTRQPIAARELGADHLVAERELDIGIRQMRRAIGRRQIVDRLDEPTDERSRQRGIDHRERPRALVRASRVPPRLRGLRDRAPHLRGGPRLCV